MAGFYSAKIYVCRLGYHWGLVDVPRKDSLTLFPSKTSANTTGVRKDEDWRVYDPMKVDPAMFVVFSELDGSESAILGFAERYGNLYDELSGCPLGDWRYQINEMQKAVALWDATKTGNKRSLSRFVRWRTDRTLEWLTRYSGPCDDAGCPLPTNAKYGDLLSPARDQLVWVIEEKEYSLRFVSQRKSGGLAFGISTDHLLCALWLQFARAVEGSVSYGRCGCCDRPFELSPSVSRSDRQFCSNACRIKAHRRRQKRAREMRAAGQTLRKIAKELGSRVATVKDWVGE